MAENKTKATDASVDDYIASRASDQQKSDCKTLLGLLKKITKQRAKMWGPSIVGFGSYRYTYESGRTGEMCLVGFALRGREIVLYLATDNDEQQSLLAKLGKHRGSKACVYFKRLADLDMAVLEQLVRGSIAELNRRYGDNGDA